MPGLLSLWHVMQENLRGNNCDTLAEYAVVKKSQSFCTLRRFFCMQRRKTAETDAKRVNLVIMTKLQRWAKRNWKRTSATSAIAEVA